MTDHLSLADRERRAQHGIIEFAEEMKAIRDENLYPGAKREPDAWKSYCTERWGQSKRSVDEAIQALPVLRRIAMSGDAARESVAVGSAARVASLAEDVQDAILEDASHSDTVKAKAKAARKAKAVAEAEGREATVDEQIEAAQAAKPKKVKKPKHKSKFTSLLAQAVAFLEDAADYAQLETLTDIENEFAWSRVEKIELHRDRIKERLHQPDHVRDWDDEAALLLAGGER